MKTFSTLFIAVLLAFSASAQTPHLVPVTENFNSIGAITSYKVVLKDQAEEWKNNNTYPSSPGDPNHIMTNGNSPLNFYMLVNTLGKKDIVVKWKQYREATDAALQSFSYQINDQPVTVYTTSLSPANGTTPLAGWYEVTAVLPPAVNNKSFVKLEWIITKQNGSAAGRQMRFDDISVTGVGIPTLTFSELTSINPNTLVLEAPLSTPDLKSYVVSGSNLVTPVDITATTTTSPDKFKISLTESYNINTYQTSVQLTPDANGTVAPTTIWVLYLGSATATTSETGTFIGNLEHVTSGITEMVALEGITNPNPPAPFPVELASFNGQVSNGGTKLLWTTASEKNNEKFVVERSQDGRNFTAIGEVSGSGNSATRRSYSFTDAQPGNGTNYYRLRQVDFDGTTSFSYVVALQVATTEATVYPTVATREVRISLPDAERGRSITVIDATGRPVATFTNTTEREIKLPLENLRSGMYFVRITDGQSQQVQRFIKQ